MRGGAESTVRPAPSVLSSAQGVEGPGPEDNVPMKVTLKLFAMLTDYLPVHARSSNIVELDVAPDASISKIIEPFGLPAKQVHLVLVNGTYIEPAKRLTQTLREGDVLAIWPPIAGG